METEPRFDTEAIEMLRRIGRDALAAKMIALFLASVGDRRDAIVAGAGNGDLLSAQRAAHLLKSSAGQMGARSLQRLSERIESAAKDGRAADLAALAADLPAECTDAESWLRSTNASLIPDSQ
jgi:HPt (histidine-containing phosphotransfer) domain-containing protein